jgi:lipopolysaccharide export system protein LptA
LPAQALMPQGVTAGVERLVPDPDESEQRLVRVRSDVFGFAAGHGGTNGSVASFQGQVLVTDTALRLESDELTVELDNPGQQARRAVASGNVVLEQAAGRVACARAVYDAQAAQVFLEGGTTWTTATREGRSDSLFLDLGRGQYRAQGEVWMRMAGSGFGAALGWIPAPAEASEPVGVTGDSEPEKPLWVEIRSDWFEYRAPPEAAGFETAVYEGDVQVREGDRFSMTSALLTLRLTSETRELQEFMAAGDVELRMQEAEGYRLARGDRMMYTAERGTVELTGMEGVEFFIVTADGVSRGVGRRAVFDRKTELLELDGRPVITTPEGEVTGNLVRLDRANSTLSAAGAWRIRLPMGTLRMPALPAP